MNVARLDKLANDSYEGLYWLGFLLADGHFSKMGRLQLELSTKDEAHLERYGNYIEFQGSIHRRRNSAMIGVSDRETLNQICQKYDIHSNKTHNPPRLCVFDRLSDDQLTALVIGFVDGDGCFNIRKERRTCNLIVIGHQNILSLFDYWFKRLQSISRISISRPRLRKLRGRTYAIVQIRNHVFNKYLKQKSLDMNLPVLKRKWDKIDMTLITGYEQRRRLGPQIEQMLKENYTVRQIVECLNVQRWFVTNYIKDRKLLYPQSVIVLPS